MDYGKAIRIVRSTKGYTQTELGKRVGKDASYISRLESGNRDPSLATLESISEALAVPYYLLILLASEENDLAAMAPEEAQLFGQSLLALLRSSRSG